MTVRALNIGVAGLRVEGDAIGVAGDNIANVNTPGFKRQRAIFQDVFNRGSNAGGSGARMQEVGQVFTQGSLVQTGLATDVAVAGDGFFIVAGTVNGVTGSFYTRAGQFRVDPSGAAASDVVAPDAVPGIGWAAADPPPRAVTPS